MQQTWEQLINQLETRGPQPRQRERHVLPSKLATIAMKAREGYTLPHALDFVRVPRSRGVVWVDLGLNSVPVFKEWLREVHAQYAEHIEATLSHRRFRSGMNAAGERMLCKALAEATQLTQEVPRWMDQDRHRAVAMGHLEASNTQHVRISALVSGMASVRPGERHQREVRNLWERGITTKHWKKEFQCQREICTVDQDSLLRVV